MKTTYNHHPLTMALRIALAGTVTSATEYAIAQTAPAGAATQSLETIEVTGSHIRRVETETASPLVTIDRATIEKTGKLTVGDLVQALPSISGAATNPQDGTGGGGGESQISLRGLDVKRTLILLNGHRLATQDVNIIPVAAIERVEVLNDGASAVYGSDAIGGVVNFITRRDYNGVEFDGDYGISDHGDGERRGASIQFGKTGDQGSIVAGISYNKNAKVITGNRDFSKDALYLSYGSVSHSGSSANPRGRIFLPDSVLAQFGHAGCDSLTRIPGASGRDPVNDYRCYDSATDSFNYQYINLLLTPAERISAYVSGTYKFTDRLEASLDVFHTRTVSNTNIAELPLFARDDNVRISADSYYNPFHTDLGAGTDYDFFTRFTDLGVRKYTFATATDQVNGALRGAFGDSSWRWDVNLTYGRKTQDNQSFGYLYYAALQQALGPSYNAGTASSPNIVCGTDPALGGSGPIAGCTPVDLFNIDDPATAAALRNYAINPTSTTNRKLYEGQANVNGSLFEMPAGTVNLAAGLAWRRESQQVDVAPADIVAPASDGTCSISQEACASSLQGSFNVKEAYVELLVPLLADKPFAHSLNLDVGTRLSDYSTFGSTNNAKFAIEWRPIEDLLLRGTVSALFRAPNIDELFAGLGNTGPIFVDPCLHLTAAQLALHPNACANVPEDFAGQGLAQVSAVTSGAVAAGIKLKPEQGRSFDYGFVYDPHWFEGFSVNADLWRIYLNDTITDIQPQTTLSLCFNNDASPYCSFIHRFSDGNFGYVQSPSVNLGRLETSGVDIGFKYRLPETPIGKFAFSFDSTYTGKYDNTPAPGVDTVHVAGHFDLQYGNFARWRALSQINWSAGDFDASLRTRYIGGISIGSEDPTQNISADYSIPYVRVHYPSTIYHDLSVGYNLARIKTRVEVGVDNIVNKSPPLLYQSGNNGNTDTLTYDAIGRFYWGRITVKF